MRELRGEVFSSEALNVGQELMKAIERPIDAKGIPLNNIDDQSLRQLLAGAVKQYGGGVVALYSIAQVASNCRSKRLLNLVSEMVGERKSTAADEDEAFLLRELAKYIAKRKERVKKE